MGEMLRNHSARDTDRALDPGGRSPWKGSHVTYCEYQMALSLRNYREAAREGRKCCQAGSLNVECVTGLQWLTKDCLTRAIKADVSPPEPADRIEPFHSARASSNGCERRQIRDGF